MEIALYIAQMIIGIVLTILVILQSRAQGMQNRDASIYHTRRGLERTLHQTTIVMITLFLMLALITSLPLFGTAPTVTPTLPS